MVEWREHPSNRVESVTNIKSSVNLLVWNFMAFYPSECKYEDIGKISELNNSYICGLIHLHREYIGVWLQYTYLYVGVTISRIYSETKSIQAKILTLNT